jgi:hypothetical protein
MTGAAPEEDVQVDESLTAGGRVCGGPRDLTCRKADD